jgi:hypothetical protein
MHMHNICDHYCSCNQSISIPIYLKLVFASGESIVEGWEF